MSVQPAQYPKRSKSNLVEQLMTELEDSVAEGEKYYSAFRDVSLKWLGYENDACPAVLDAAHDRGFDAYRMAQNEVDIFQFKSQDFTKKTNILRAAGPDILKDLSRILTFLSSSEFAEEKKNKKLKRFVYQLQTAIDAISESEEFFVFRINLIALYDGLTEEAKNELTLLEQKFDVIKIFGKDALVEINFIDLDYLLSEKWRETNTRWIDADGKENEWVTIHYAQTGAGGFINDKTSLILYARARDFIDVYRRFGYQIFESNVRCEITKSQVNDSIRSQVQTVKGIDQFKTLNNGVTIVCANRKTPANGKVELHQPQVVNGLQTITSLFEAYESLTSDLQKYFDNNCYVLTRIYDSRNIEDIPKLVRATNNQNKMEQRNLRSNEKDQVSFERSFAELHWFFERKDFAWTAFERAESQWTTLRGHKAREFKIIAGKGRPIVRRVDNEEVGQHWLAFLGFVDDAAQRRRLIFEDDQYYSRIFQTRVVRSAFDYNYEFDSQKNEEEAILQSPSADSMLLAHLTYRLAKQIVTTSAKVRENMIAKRGYDDLPEDEVDKRLTEDPEYITGLALSAGPFLFTEMCGLLLLRAFGADLYSGTAKKVLERSDLRNIFHKLDFEPLRAMIQTREYGPSDIFTMLWLLFADAIRTELAESDQWRNAFFTESSKPRYMYREQTRRRILQRVLDLDKRAQSRALNYDFSNYFDKVGIINHIKKSMT
jgi:hypothetical protein